MNCVFYFSAEEHGILLDIIDDVIIKYEDAIASAEKRGSDYECSKLYLKHLINIRDKILLLSD